MRQESAPTQAEIRAKGQRILELGRTACTIDEGDNVLSSDSVALPTRTMGNTHIYGRLVKDRDDDGVAVGVFAGISGIPLDRELDVLWVTSEGEPHFPIDDTTENSIYQSIEEMSINDPEAALDFLDLANKLEAAFGQPA